MDASMEAAEVSTEAFKVLPVEASSGTSAEVSQELRPLLFASIHFHVNQFCFHLRERLPMDSMMYLHFLPLASMRFHVLPQSCPFSLFHSEKKTN